MNNTPVINTAYQEPEEPFPITYCYVQKGSSSFLLDLSQDHNDDSRYGTIHSKEHTEYNGLLLEFTADCTVFGYVQGKAGEFKRFNYGHLTMDCKENRWCFNTEGEETSILYESFLHTPDYVALERLEKEVLRAYANQYFLQGTVK